MGASNALRVYSSWSGRLGDQAMRVMVYMALVARDADAAPWFGLGHEAIAEIALGRERITRDKDPKAYEAAMRAVRRPVAELHKAGAITTAKRATNNGGHVRYRLWLDGPSPDVSRPVNNTPQTAGDPVDNPPSQDEKRPVNGAVIGRNVVGHRTKSVQLTGRETSYPIEEEQRRKEERKTSKQIFGAANCGRQPRAPPTSLTA